MSNKGLSEGEDIAMITLKEMATQFIQQNALLKEGDRILVACSGGVDSVGLLHFLASHKNELSVDIAAVHVDHMLRGAESAEDGSYVESLCQSYGIPFYGGSVPVPEILAVEGGNLQAVCREGRYAHFSKVMAEMDFNVLATAHHAEDQLETLLMQLTKGVYPIGMSSSREIESGVLIRPFLSVMKADIHKYLEQYAVTYREDPSNHSDAYMRNRFRHHVIPFVLEENALAARNSVKLAGHLQEDEELLNRLATEEFERNVKFASDGLPMIDVLTFSAMHLSLQRRVITLLLNYLYDGETVPVEHNSTLVTQLIRHLHSTEGNVTIDLPRGFRFVREYNQLTFSRTTDLHKRTAPQVLPKGVWTQWQPDMMFFWDELGSPHLGPLTDKDEVLYFDLPNSALPLSIRNRKDGDRILLPGMEHQKRLSRLLIDEKVVLRDRNRLPIVITAQDEVCAVPGVRYGKAFSKNELMHNKYILCVRNL